jgi:hypothetical protein
LAFLSINNDLQHQEEIQCRTTIQIRHPRNSSTTPTPNRARVAVRAAPSNQRQDARSVSTSSALPTANESSAAASSGGREVLGLVAVSYAATSTSGTKVCSEPA